MFEDFERTRLTTADGVGINVVHAGSGPPLLLLHGFPQCLALWHEVAPALAADRTVVALDLRGYGDSDKPGPSDDHSTYSFRAMAGDAVEVMRHLGHETFDVVGHDRGARVAHRLVLDTPDAVRRWAVLDIVPTRHVYATVDRDLALAYYHWFFLPQPFDLPERMIGADPIGYLHSALGSFGGALEHYQPEALAEYERCYADPRTVHATCEDYRAGAGIDLRHDEADAGRRVERPLLVLWGEHGIVGTHYDPLAVWAEYAVDVRGFALPAGHFLVDEQPRRVIDAVGSFLAE